MSNPRTRLNPSSSTMSDLTEMPKLRSDREESLVNATSSDTTSSQILSSTREDLNVPSLVLRTGSPFQNPSQTLISPSQSILNLSQKGLASARRQQWEASSMGVMGQTPLRLYKREASNATSVDAQPITRNIVSDSSKETDSVKSAFREGETVAVQSSDAPNFNLALGESLSMNLRDETLSPSRAASYKSHRQPVPRLPPSVSGGSTRSPSHMSALKGSVTTFPMSAIPTSTGPIDSVYQMRRRLDNAGRSPSPISKSTTMNGSSGVKDTADHPPETSTGKHEEARSRAPDDPSRSAPILSQATFDQQRPAFDCAVNPPELGTICERTEDNPFNPLFRAESIMTAKNGAQMQGYQIHSATSSPLPQLNSLPHIQEPSQYAQPDSSYFNYHTGNDISDASPPLHSAPFSLAKTYSDWDSPSYAGAYAIPMSPDVNAGGAIVGGTIRLYNNSPLSKSPGKRFVGKVVDVAKKAVPAGMKQRAGNFNRIIHNDRLTFGGPTSKDRLKSYYSPAMSQVPSMVERQEAQELQPHWGNELYGTMMGTGETKPLPVIFSASEKSLIPKERELPPIPQGRILHVEDSTTDAESSGGTHVWTYEGGTRDQQGEARYPIKPDSANQEGNYAPEIEKATNPEHGMLPIPVSEKVVQDQHVRAVSLLQEEPTTGSSRDAMRDPQPVQHERGLSVFKNRQAMMRRPQHLTTPAPLKLKPKDGNAISSSKRVPPVIAVPLLSAVDDVVTETPMNAVEPLRFPLRSGQTTQTEEFDKGQSRLDTSPTKTERLKNVADWAQGAAIAPPPPANEPQNHNQEAALYRDEDRLDMRPCTPPLDGYSPLATSAGRALPSLPVVDFGAAHSGLASDHTVPHSEYHMEAVEAQERELEEGTVSPFDPKPAGNGQTGIEASSPVATSPEQRCDPRLLDRSLLNSDILCSNTESLISVPKDINAQQAISPDIVQHFDEIRAAIQLLQQSTEASKVDDSLKAALMSNKDQTGDILAKTDVVLDIISAIKEKLETFPHNAPVKSEEQRATKEPRSTILIDAPGNQPDLAEVPEAHPPVPVSEDGGNAEQPIEQNVEASSENANDALNEQVSSPICRTRWLRSLIELFAQFKQLAASMTELQIVQRDASESLTQGQSNLTGHLEHLNIWANGFNQQLRDDMHGLQRNLDGVIQTTGAIHAQNAILQRELGIGSVGGENAGEAMHSLDLRSRLDHMTSMITGILAGSDTQGAVAGRLDRIIEVLNRLQNKPEPITTEVMAAIVERENKKHIDLLRSVAMDVLKDMQNERGRMVQELSAATAVEVKKHVTHMNAQFEQTRQELERLELQRKETEETIADLLRLQSRYKGPASTRNTESKRKIAAHDPTQAHGAPTAAEYTALRPSAPCVPGANDTNPCAPSSCVGPIDAFRGSGLHTSASHAVAETVYALAAARMGRVAVVQIINQPGCCIL
ncbi:hypothetical protein QFC19_003935 [Naganishia cerealis]|uniref:Uncharacterized protein n=1 Tax=Naganishia cerealis TaxID=610337 RepID=A0ACC2W0G8_9TREE|nr:hypothetical protein QFC19_003935 [Naganishia cerealis]